MATMNYKDIINLATSGFRNIQNTLAGFSGLGVSAVGSSTSNNVVTYTGSITPASMVTAIGKLAVIRKDNNENVITDDGTFIKGKIAYYGSNITQNPSINTSTRVVSYSKTLAAGYYPAITISGSYTITQGKVTMSGGAVSAANLASSGEVTNAFKPEGVVSAADATGNYAFAKITRAAVTRTVTEGYVKDNSTDANSLSASTVYVKIANAGFSSTAPAISLSQTVNQYEYNGDTNLNTADLAVLESTKPSGAHYRVISTPGYSVSSTGKTTATAGYTKAGDVSTGISVTKSSSNEAVTRYIKKSSLNRSTLNYDNQTATITAGYYPSNRTVSLSMDPAEINITNTLTQHSLTYFDGTSSTDAAIFIPSTAGYNKYYTIQFKTTVNKSVATDGYISSNSGTINTPSDKTITKYLAQAVGSVSVGSCTTNLTYSQKNAENYLLSLAENANNTNTGIVKVENENTLTGTAGTNYWIVEAETVQKQNASYTAKADITTAGYIPATYNNTTILGTGSNTAVAGGGATGDYKFYVKKASVSTGLNGSTRIETSTPTISLNAAGNGTNSIIVNGEATTTSKPTSGYFIAVKSSAVTGTANLTPTYTVGSGGYLPKANATAGSAVQVTAAGLASAVTYVPITSGVAHNGYVTTSGWIPNSTNYYTLSYDSTEQCVDFVFNN